jgi:hypothetical protein
MSHREVTLLGVVTNIVMELGFEPKWLAIGMIILTAVPCYSILGM